MPRHGRADRDVRSFDVANLTHHDHIGVLSQNVAQTFGKSEVDLRFHLDLRNTSNPVFDWFIDSNNAPLYRIDAGEKAIKGSRFSAAGWTGEENDSVGLCQEMSNNFLLLFAEIEPI